MRISRILIQNFRNFKNLDISLSDQSVIVGENKIGKSNLLFALRLILDPSLPDTARQLGFEDFWDGLSRPLSKEDKIIISIEISDFDDDDNLLSILADCLVNHDPMISRLSYVFQPISGLSDDPKKESDYEFLVYGGDSPEKVISYDTRNRMPLDVMPALRDAESDLFNWRYSPLRPLLDDSSSRISPDLLSSIASKISAANNGITEVVEIKSLAERITTKLEELVGSYQAFETKLGFTPADTEKLIRSLRLFIDNGKRGINEASLGSTNLLYIALRILELEQLVDQNKRNHTFLAIEEPEAHLHPHLQRLVFQKLLRSRTNQSEEPDECEHSKFTTLILTTHSPHIVSVSPIRSLIALRKTVEGNATEGVSTSNLELSENDIVDLERYIDVSRGEIVFARGILLVEGESELYILPAICKLLGKNLDELGITVCSVHGTNFAPYIKFLGSKGLDKPFAVLTDNDPQTGKISIGIQRLISLLPLFEPIEDLTNISTDEVKRLGKAHGLFLNDHTLEVDLFKCGQHKSICKTIIELSDKGAAKKRATVWNDKPDELDIDRFLKDIEEIGKGRFAQRFSSNISGVSYPNYILDAIDYVSNKCR